MTDQHSFVSGAQVEALLFQKGWTRERETESTRQFRSPPALGENQAIAVVVPRDDTSSSAQEMLHAVVRTIALLHGRDARELTAVLAADCSVVSVRLDDDETIRGSVPFLRLDGLIEAMRRALLDTADFLRTGLPTVREHSVWSQAFLRGCRFLPAEVGSYVTRVQLPSDQPLEEPSLWVQDPLRSSAVIGKLADVTELIAHQVLAGDREIYEDEFLMEAARTVNVSVLSDLRDILRRGGKETVHFTFADIDGSRQVAASDLTRARLGELDRFVDYVQERVDSALDVELVGKIIRLHSRNPLKNKNYVAVETIFEGRPTLLGMTLRSGDYGIALQAHRANQEVRVHGQVQRLKRQLSLVSLDLLEPVQ